MIDCGEDFFGFFDKYVWIRNDLLCFIVSGNVRLGWLVVIMGVRYM